MTQDSLVSIVIPCYNHGHFIEEAIASVEECRAATYELIIVDDGSTDEATVKAMTELKAAGYGLITQRSKGLGSARNAGIAAARGMYILPLDSDNKIRAGFVERPAKILDERLDIGIVYGDFQYFGEADDLRESEEYLFRRYAVLLKKEYDSYHTWDYHGRQFHRRPVRTLFRLALNAYFPRLHKRIYREVSRPQSELERPIGTPSPAETSLFPWFRQVPRP